MKKIVFIMQLMVACIFVSCSNNNVVDESSSSNNLPSTKVELISRSNGNGMLRTTANSVNPTVKPENAYFFIRLDKKIIDTEEAVRRYDAEYYFPQTKNKKSVRNNLNLGKINANSPLITTSESAQKNGIQKYVVDCTGANCEAVFVGEAPTLEKLIEADQSGNDFSSLLAQKEKLKIIWYVVKKQADKWHVDGIVTTKDTPTADISDVIDEYPRHGEVEVDVHQQEHQSWNEIKTSVHVRDSVDCHIEIPISNEYLTEADDFNIRTYNAYYTVENKPYPITVCVRHNEDNISIDILGINKAVFDAIKANNENELTIEIHSYYQNINHLQVWEWMKGTTVSTYPKTTIKGQVTSAFYNDSKKIPR